MLFGTLNPVSDVCETVTCADSVRTELNHTITMPQQRLVTNEGEA